MHAKRRDRLKPTQAAPALAGPARLASYAIVALLVITPFLVLSEAKEGFRLIQGLTSGWLALASVAIASALLRHVGAIDAATLWQRPAIRALTPLLLIVAIGGFFTSHPAHFRAAFADFAIGVVCVIGWSLAFDAVTLRRLLLWTIAPAAVIAALGLDQFAGLFGLLDGLNIEAPTARLRITSTIGNPGDLAAFVVLPTLIAVSRLRDSSRNVRLALAVAIAVMVAIIAATATLAAAIALIVGVAIWLWLDAGPARKPALVLALATALLVTGAIAVSAPMRARVADKVAELTRGDFNALLTGRLDGWRAAIAMLRQSPVTGVGQGAFRAEFADTRLRLTDQGVVFYAEQQQVMLATPHNEALSVAAEQGGPGLIALAWAIWCLLASAMRLTASSRALAWAGIAALALLSAVSFPLHVASIAWPWLLFLAWIFRASSVEEVTA